MIESNYREPVGRMNDTDALERLRRTSIACIVEHQHASGAFPAGPTFSQYGYSWLRDGTYIAYSLLLQGHAERCRRFIEWVARTVTRHAVKIERLPELLAGSPNVEKQAFLGARYTLDGEEDQTDWPNFQIDGYGSWLWLIDRYLQETGATMLPDTWTGPVQAVIHYLGMVWQLPNSDCWEEFADERHPATLACIGGGLQAISRWVGPTVQGESEQLASRIEQFLLDNRHPDGFFPKFLGSQTIDASLLWLGVPYGIIPLDNPSLVETITRIEHELLHDGGGVQRYPQDTYYGGGLWIPLAAFLGWYYLATDRPVDAQRQLEWIARQQTTGGLLPEQVLVHTNKPSMIGAWEERWGKVATPLLWSHAMFLILDFELSRYYS
ncbi:MAG TPA: hypothetical protein DIW48_00785 [Sphaerochaeta sp.]|nr:hypothetical protein [Sphaerochaeta sp.]